MLSLVRSSRRKRVGNGELIKYRGREGGKARYIKDGNFGCSGGMRSSFEDTAKEGCIGGVDSWRV